MKRCFLLILSLLSIGICQSQVGINTKDPQGMLHIDPKSDTNGNAGTTDDVIVTAAGQLGIGTITPDATLHIKTTGTVATPISGFRLEDGNQGVGKSLAVIGTNGLATWKNLVPIGSFWGIRSGSAPHVPINTDNYYNSGSYIDLGRGRWLVQIISLIAVQSSIYIDTPLWVSSTLADAMTVVNDGEPFANVVTPDIEGTGGRVAGSCWTGGVATIIGSLIINNSSAATKRYYYLTGETTTNGVLVPGGYIVQPGGAAWGENQIVATLVPSDL